MSYLAKSSIPESNYLDLRFNLHIDEAMAVAERTRELCKHDPRAFCFLTNYFLISFSNLEK
jgi:hypothetical protein